MRGSTPTEAIRKAAGLRVRPITMTALAAFFALIPGALALERGSEANAPLARAILGGLLAGEPATLFVLPALYSLFIHDSPEVEEERKRRAPPAMAILSTRLRTSSGIITAAAPRGTPIITLDVSLNTGSARGCFPTGDTECPGALCSASRSSPRTGKPGRSPRDTTSMNTPRSALRKTSPSSSSKR